MQTNFVFLLIFVFSVNLGIQGEPPVINSIEAEELDLRVEQEEFCLIYLYSGQCNSDSCKNGLQNVERLAAMSSVPDIKIFQSGSQKIMSLYGLKQSPSLLFFRKAYPTIYTGSLSDIEELSMWMENSLEVSTRSLNDDDFEHLTQASTGATTGDWFVLFYNPGCSSILATWEAVAIRLKHRLNIAKVDVSTNQAIQEQFNVAKCPTIIFLRLGKMYTYNLKERDFQSLVSFAEGWYKNVKAEKVPTQATPFDALVENIVLFLRDLFDRPWGKVAFVSGIVVVLLMIGACFLCCVPNKPKGKMA